MSGRVVRQNGAQSSSFTIPEVVSLERTSIKISKDAVRGSDHKDNAFYKAIKLFL